MSIILSNSLEKESKILSNSGKSKILSNSSEKGALILSNDSSYPELKYTILTNSNKSLVIANKLKVSENILKANRLDYLISKAKMETNLEYIPLEALNNMIAA